MDVTRITAALAGAALLAISATSGETAHRAGGGLVAAAPLGAQFLPAPENISDCENDIGIRCYAPGHLEQAYDLAGLHAAGIDGSGVTIAIVEPFGSPTIAADLHHFDQTFSSSPSPGIPADPAIAKDPKVTIITPAGAPPPFDPTDDDMVFWAFETTLDVEWAHVFAPGADILLVVTPVNETEGIAGFPEIVQAENYVIDHHLADIISQSFGATEQTFPSTNALMELRDAFKNADRHDVTVLAGSGDTGSTNFQTNLSDLYTMPVSAWPSTDPLVTSVGGTSLSLDDTGARASPDVVWNDSSAFGQPAASGGGLSSVFKRPDFQKGLKPLVDGARGVPDISMSAGVDGSVWIYYSFLDPSLPFWVGGGVSESVPEVAGIVALADQVAGQSLGNINDALYSIPYGGGLVDVTSGDNDVGEFTNSDGKTYHVPGFSAGPGYDLASGLGTIDPPRFVPTLAAQTSGHGDDHGHDDGHRADCSGPLTYAAFTGDVRVKKGATCSLTDSAIDGDLVVDGGSVSLNGVTVGGSVEIAHAPAGTTVTVCDAWIGGNLKVHDNRSTTTIGCSAGNTIGRNLDCRGNNPAPTGGNNAVDGRKSGQCAGF